MDYTKLKGHWDPVGEQGRKAIPTEGDRVEYCGVFRNSFYPPRGTKGTVLKSMPYVVLVQWDNYTDGDGRWYCPIGSVKLCEE